MKLKNKIKARTAGGGDKMRISIMALLISMLMIIPAGALSITYNVNAGSKDVDYQYGFELGDSNKGGYLIAISSFWELPIDEEKSMREAAIHVKFLGENYQELLSRYQGLADALGIDLLEVIATAMNMPSFLFRGCTTSASAPPATKDEVYLSWNLDIMSFWGLKQIMTFPIFTVTSIPGKYRYITFGLPLIAGIGLLNEKGLALVGNACGTSDCGDGLTAIEIPNMIMEQCSTAKEAAEFMRGIERFSSSAFSLFNMNYLWGDAEGGIASVEATHNYIGVGYSGWDEYHYEYDRADDQIAKVRGMPGILGQGNHHQYLDYHETGAPSPGPDGYPSSWIRCARMWELLRENYGEIDLEKVESFTADSENGIQAGPIKQGGFNSICRTEFPFGFIDYYIGSLTGKYVHDGMPAVVGDLVILGPDTTNWALVIQPKERIIWWAAGWPSVFPFWPIYCAPLLGVDGPSVSVEDSFLTFFCNRWVTGLADVGYLIQTLPPALTTALNYLIVMVLKLLASIMEKP
jgi:hypothetical protein